MRVLLLGTGVHRLHFNTSDPSTGAPITLAGTPSCRTKVNGGASSASGATLTVDVDGITGKHELELDIDNGTLALADGDEVHPYIHAGTVGGVSVAGKQPIGFEDILVADDELTDGELASIIAALKIEDFGGLSFEELISGLALNFAIVAGVLTIKDADGTTLWTRDLTRSALNAITVSEP